MATTDVHNFLLSLMAAMADAAGLSPADPLARPLYVHDAPETAATAVFSVLRIYGGDETAGFAGERSPRVRVQIDTRGKGAASAVLQRAWQLHETLLDAERRPRMHWSIDGKRQSAAGAIEADPAGGWVAWVCELVSVPGLVARDEQQRHMATSNFQIEFERAGA